jgi:cytidine deaminase
MTSNRRLNELTAADRALLEAAAEQREHAYAPYSKFTVGAAVRSSSGRLHSGANMENASYGLTMCAEVAALTRAVAEGDFRVEAIAVVGGPMGGTSTRITTPCGRCRQLILEAAQVAKTNTRVLCASSDLSMIVETTIEELLPLGFGPADLDPAKASEPAK